MVNIYLTPCLGPLQITKSLDLKKATLDAGLAIDMIRLGTPLTLVDTQILQVCIAELETLALKLRISTTRDADATGGHGLVIPLAELVMNFNRKYPDKYAPEPGWLWAENYANCPIWLVDALAWLDQVLATMYAVRDYTASKTDYKLGVEFCVAWYNQLADVSEKSMTPCWSNAGI